ncbi:MAG: HAMP domain-containing histidine kinase [Betaproteobacteria bacterium]|nr:HAMP domain-containing histidine kinase [Betaproteobacteria bacterium]MCL2885589.1 HAMP domain-containing histidine kinase [Betaproteobacteria bacterium]
MPLDNWLSATWEANWRSYQYFNLYRLVVAGTFLLLVLFPSALTMRIILPSTSGNLLLLGGYMSAVVAGLLLSVYWREAFNLQLSLQVAVDIVVVNLLMLSAGGIDSGLAVLLFVSLAAASLVGRGRLVLFYAALATLALLGTQIYGTLFRHFDASLVVQAGLISAGFFATAILTRLLGQRVMINENLARQHGIALDNQIRISQRVVERMQDGVLIVDADGRIVRYNPVAQTMLGLPEAAAQLPAALAAALAAWIDGGPESLQFTGFAERRLLARFERTASSDQEVLIFLEDLGRIQERAQQMKLAALGRLTASIAHEIRNPLSAISHAGELLREERRSEVCERLLCILRDNILRLDRIVQDVLLLGRQNNARPEPLALDEFCSAFIEDFVSTEELSPEIFNWQSESGVILCFDRTHLHQILWNLASNALRYSSGGVGAIRLEALAAPDSGRVELHVIDDGPGVPDEVREQLFEPFFTLHHTGSGLGLYIARELCAASGGSLSLGANAPGGHFIITGRNEACQPLEASAERAQN